MLKLVSVGSRKAAAPGSATTVAASLAPRKDNHAISVEMVDALMG